MVALLLKYVLPVVAVIALLFGVYEWGHANGTDAGYKSGWDAQQVTINKMVSDANEEAKVHSWRSEQLRNLGLSSAIAKRFAGLVDWHEIAALVARGCPPELALEIVR